MLPKRPFSRQSRGTKIVADRDEAGCCWGSWKKKKSRIKDQGMDLVAYREGDFKQRESLIGK